MRLKRCKACRQQFNPTRPLQAVCSPLCAHQHAINSREKLQRKETKEKLQALKTRSQWLKEAQVEFNKFIRERDRDLPCISCGRFHTGSYDAGHFRSTGAAPQLRFDEANCHKQCVPCNQFKSGNAIEYRIGLVKRIGVEAVEALERNNEPAKFSIEDAKRIKAEYKQKLKALKEGVCNQSE